MTVGPDVQVAGRSAYSLELAPRTDGTLLAKVVIAVDGQTGMPLRVTVSARGQAEPAFEAGFTSLSLAAPEDATFNFVAPPGATVKELPAPAGPAQPGLPGKPGIADQPGPQSRVTQLSCGTMTAPRPTVTGKGWETVVGFPAAA